MPTPEKVPTAEQARKHMDALAPYVLPKGEAHWEPVYAYLEHLITENATLRQQAEAQAREERLREAAEAVIYRAGECGLLTGLRTDLQGALLLLRDAVTPPGLPAICATCGGSGVVSRVYSKNIPGVYDAYVTTAPCPDCRPPQFSALKGATND